jgi:putative spermidine/putrescine transport system substrate-binding protein
MLKACVLALSAAAVVVNGQGTIEGDNGDIMMVVEEGQKVGFKVGEKKVLFNDMADNFPNQWRDFSDSAIRAVQLGLSIGAAAQPQSSGSTHAGSGIPGFENLSWSEIEQLAAGGTVNFWMWDGAAHINTWVDGWLGARLQEKFQITIKREPNQGAPAAVAKVAEEMKAPKTSGCPQFSPSPCGGSVDLIWINKANFKAMKDADNLFGPWANKVPNSENFDFFSPSVAFDAGVPTQGYEMPYNSAQVVFFHNTKKLPSPPRTIPDLVDWIKKNKNRFAYSNPTDFTGAVLVMQFFYHYAGEEAGGSWKDFLGDFNEDLYMERAPLVFQKLREIDSFVKLDGGKYPADHTAIRKWFGSEDVWLDVAYDPNHASTNILNGNYEETTKSYVMDTGTIANTNFVAIPANSQNKAAALVAGNMIGSIEAVFTRAQPERWGALPAIDANGKKMVESGWDAAFDYITTHHAAPTVEALTAGRLTELSSEYTVRVKQDWQSCVINKDRSNSACVL